MNEYETPELRELITKLVTEMRFLNVTEGTPTELIESAMKRGEAIIAGVEGIAEVFSSAPKHAIPTVDRRWLILRDGRLQLRDYVT